MNSTGLPAIHIIKQCSRDEIHGDCASALRLLRLAFFKVNRNIQQCAGDDVIAVSVAAAQTHRAVVTNYQD
jgi:hypothetical protein